MATGDKPFTRQQIYEIRARGDGGESAPSILRDFPRVSLETIRRVIRRDTYREIGAGGAERPMMSNRLVGEHRHAGEALDAWHGSAADPAERARKELEEAEARIARTPAGQAGPTPDFAAWTALQANLQTPQDDPLGELLTRGRVVRREAFDPGAGEASPAAESAEAILARQAAALPPPPPSAEGMLKELGTQERDRDEG